MEEAERRRAPRVRAHRLVAYERFDAEGNKLYEGFVRTLDISPKGALLEAFEPCELGETIALKVLLSGDRWLVVKGEVVHAKPQEGGTYWVGLRLARLSAEDQALLEEETQREL